jgi:ATP-binding cassette, subfamily F, member 3
MSQLLAQFSHVFHSFGSCSLFENLSLSINRGEVFALIGENGAGKTTLLQFLSGELWPDRGNIARMPNLTVGFLPQEIETDSSLNHLSSGQRVRIALTRALIDNPDLLLLDEPTNHLDADTLRWLTEFLRVRKGATILVSHDRKFINATCNRILELKDGKLTCYGGNYDFYLTEKQRLLERQMKAYEQWVEEKHLLKRKIQAMTFSKGKASLPKDRNIMAYDRRGGNHQRSEGRKIDAMKNKLSELEESPLQHPKPTSVTGLRFAKTALASECVIELEGVTKTYDGKAVFTDLNRILYRGDRVALVGPNGAGKTTLIQCIAGLIPIDSGQIMKAPTAKIAYLDQEVQVLPLEKTPVEYFADLYQLSEESLRREQHKAGLRMDPDLIHRPFATLSTGQRKRFALLSLVLQRPNVLLLDEPTNHLDLPTLEALETALLQFEGAILFVSHDETFREKLATQIWTMSPKSQ